MREVGGALHPASTAALAAVREERAKAILLLNRRGWSNFISCRSCGRVWRCEQCDVALVLHRAASRLECHHCGHSEALPTQCPDCGSSAVARHGEGTERLAHELAAIFDDGSFPVFRLDADVAAGNSVAHVLARFERSASGLLIGTQMVAKGHDFPDVRLGIVFDADGTLRFPDFRSEERTFALISQLAGRVGRGGSGRVFVQTMDPEARAIRFAAAHDSEGFTAGELERRRALSYPPYGHLIRVICSARETRPARAAAEAIGDELAQRGVRALGPAPLFRLRGRERSLLLIKTADRAAAAHAVGEVVEQAAGDGRSAQVHFAVDVEPQ
jgi:primosomal protein N' (replication factor Y)